jgi:hypothetical protein
MTITLHRIYIMIMIVFVIFTSCSTPIKSENVESIKIDVKSEPVEIEFDDYFSSKNVIALETNENSIFSKIDRICLYDKKIFILDRKLNSVLVFKENGSFLYKIQNIGRGPQEYAGLMDFTIDEKNKNIVLYTHRPYSLYIHNMDGSFIKKVKLNDLYINIASNDGKIFFLNNQANKKYLLFGYDVINGKEDGFLEIDNHNEIYSNYGIGYPLLTKDENIHLSFPYSETIYEQNEKGVQAKYYVDFGNQKMPEDIYKTKKSFSELFDYGRSNNYGYGICNFRENKDYITFNYQLTNLVIYSKKTKKLKTVSNIKNNDMINGSYIAHDGNDNNFVSQYPAKAFKIQMSIYKKEGVWDKVPDNIKKLDNLVTDYDNPLLLIYKFK